MGGMVPNVIPTVMVLKTIMGIVIVVQRKTTSFPHLKNVTDVTNISLHRLLWMVMEYAKTVQ